MSGSKQTSEDPETHIEIQITNKQATSTMLTTIKPNTSELCVHIYIYMYIYNTNPDQVLSVLQNWQELEQMLGIFVSKMEEPLALEGIASENKQQRMANAITNTLL